MSKAQTDFLRRWPGGPDDLPETLRRGAASIGNFDGVHLGHARIVERLRAMARRLGGPAVVLTFDPHPAAVLRLEAAPPPLCSLERKAELLAELGVEAVVACRTDRDLLARTPREFFDDVLLGWLEVRGLVEGCGFHFGRERSGDVRALGELCRRAGVELDVVEPVERDGLPVSSSRIRALVAAGRIAEAAALLGRPYRIRGVVIRGSGRGVRLGFPTANVGGIGTLLPGEGIYAGFARIDNGDFPAAISLGPNPTFNEGGFKVEAYLLDFQGDLYGRTIEVDFLARLRDIERFDSADTLVARMEQDVLETRRVVGS
jgi:riboflavin kinase / FMN adenylyltransferase